MSAQVYGWEVDIAVRTGIFSEVVRTHHYRGVSEQRARRNAMLTRNAIRVLAVRAIEEDEFINAWGLGTEGGRVGGRARRKKTAPAALPLALGVALLCLPAPALAQTAFSSLVLVGDSITRGHGTSGTGQSAPILYSLAAGLGIDPGQIVNLGVNGRTTSDWLNGPIEAAVSAASPHSLFLVMLGTNDARIGPSGRSVGEWLFHARLIVERIHAGGHEAIWNAAPFIAAGAAGWPADSGDRVALYNARIVDTGAIVGDTTSWDWFRDRPARLPDGVHPDDTGAIALGQMWACAAQERYGIVLPESGAGMFVVVFLAFLAGSVWGRRGWRWK